MLLIDMANSKWKRAAIILTLIVLAVDSLIMPAAASTEKKEDVKTVRVGYVNFENYQEGGEGEYKRGFGYEYLQRVAYSTGWKYEYVYGSFSELFKMLEDGDIDLMGDISYTEERAEKISFSALPQGRENYYIYTTAEQEDIDPFDPSTLNGRRIGVTANSYQYGLLCDWIKENNYNCKVVEYDGSKEAAEALNSGKVDAMIMTDMASTGGYVPVESVGHAEFYFGVNKKRQDILNELNYALREIQTTDPYYNEVTYAKYITSSLSNGYLSNRERKWLDEHRNTVRLGYLTSNLPYCDETQDGLLKGQLAVIVKSFEQDFGIHVDARGFSNVDDLIGAAKNGDIDLFGPLYSDAWLAEQYGFINSNAFTSTTFILLYKGEHTEKTTEKIVCASDSAIQKGAVEVLFPDAERLEYDSREECLQAVINGDATCMIASAATMNILKQYKTMKKLNMVELPKAAEICLGTLRGNSEVLNIANRAIFASSEDMNGAALMDNAYVDIPITLVDYLEEHALAVILILVIVIALVVAIFIYYLQITSKLTKMKNKNEELSQQAFRDGLTKVGNRAGYLEAQRKLQTKIDAGEQTEFAMVVADVNGLKPANDVLGHESGDMLIKNTSKCICGIFKHSPVFRIGGDEFVIILNGEDYKHRNELLEEVRSKSIPCDEEMNLEKGDFSAAFGIAEYSQASDCTVAEVFARADEAMYSCKKQMKREHKK